ncbi:MAG: hypothetical protein ABWY12_17555 [Burkholderiales bacterium]
MNCPTCNKGSEVIDSRLIANGVRRRRQCLNDHRFTTIEQVPVSGQVAAHLRALAADLEATAQIGETSIPSLEEQAHVLLRRLTKPQRLMVTDEVRAIGNPERLVLCGDRVFAAANGPTRNVLKKTGLVEMTQFGPMTLSPLGLAVRTLATTLETPSHKLGDAL